ncbi:MAG: VCBS repeat-containing protein, partial [Bacteroidales bacterium]|nr:VCBS repeat-containing protein [Bacteroidales bacterium]
GDVLWATAIYSGYTYRQTCMTTISDINNDGYRDVIVGTAGGDRSIIAFSGKTGQQIWKHDTHEYGDGGWVYQVDAAYDYNNDGKPDVLASTGNDGNNTGPVRVYCLNGLTGTSIWERPNPAAGPLFSVIGVEDFTGDGKPDVVTGGSNQQESEGGIFGINGASGQVEWTRPASGTSVWGLMQLDDINGDGKKDVATGDFSGMMLLLNAATGSVLHNKNLGYYIILRLEDMGDVNKDGYRDILVAYSGSQGIVLSGLDGEYIWTVPLADKAWNVANIGDISWDGYNDAIIGTLFQSNYGYFLDGTDGTTMQIVPASDAVDALNAIPDIVGDLSMEMVLGARNGIVTCFSGGYDSTYIGEPDPALPPENILLTVYPNPFREQLNIHIELDHQASVKMELVDMTGRFICLIREGIFSIGKHAIRYDRYAASQEIKPGLFFLKATIGTQVQWKKVIAE